jgi:hypothetical protein
MGEVEVQLHSFITSALDGDEWSTSGHGRFTAYKEPRYTMNMKLSVPEQAWTF